MAEFQTPDSLLNRNRNESGDSPASQVDTFANAAIQQINQTNFLHDFETERDDNWWKPKVIRLQSNIRRRVDHALGNIHTRGNLNFDTDIERTLWNDGNRNSLRQQTLNAIQDARVNTRVSLSALETYEKLLGSMKVNLLGSDEEGIRGNLQVAHEQHEETRARLKWWHDFRRSHGDGIRGQLGVGSRGRGNRYQNGESPTYREDRKIAGGTLLTGAGVGLTLLGGTTLGAAPGVALVGAGLIQKRRRGKTYEQYTERLQTVFDDLENRVHELKTRKEQQVAQAMPIFQREFLAIPLADRGLFITDVQAEIANPSSPALPANMARLAPVLASIPKEDRLECYKRMPALDQSDTREQAQGWSDKFDDNTRIIEQRRSTIEDQYMRDIEFTNLIEQVEAYGLDENVKAPKTEDLVRNFLAAVDDDTRSNITRRFQDQSAYTSEEQILQIFSYCNYDLYLTGDLQSVFDHIPLDVKSQFVAYLKQLSGDTFQAYQKLNSQEAIDSANMLDDYRQSAQSIITNIKGIKTFPNINDNRFKETTGSLRSLDEVYDAFKRDFETTEQTVTGKERKELIAEWEKARGVFEQLQQVRQQFMQARKQNDTYTSQPRDTYPDPSDPQFQNQGSSYQNFNQARYNAAVHAWERQHGAYLQSGPELPTFNFDALDRSLREVQRNLNNYQAPSRGVNPETNERIYRKLMLDASKSLDTEYLKALHEKQNNHFDSLQKLLEGTDVEIDLFEKVPGQDITPDLAQNPNNLFNVTDAQIFEKTENIIVLSAVVNGENAIIMISKTDNFRHPNVGVYFNVVGYDPSVPADQQDFQYPKEANCDAISINTTIH